MHQNIIQHAFSTPQYFREMFLANKLIKGERKNFSGKSFICVSLTRFCSVGCEFCFFKSGNPYKDPTKEDRFFSEGQKKFVDFANQMNLGYLLVSGGGEPMMERNTILKIVREVKSDRIVLVTSGNWAQDKAMADLYLGKIARALSERQTHTQLTIRLSIDQGHQKTLGLAPMKHLLALFKEKYSHISGLDLRIHTIEGDPTLQNLLNELKKNYDISVLIDKEPMVGDGVSAIKFVPHQTIFSIDGYPLKVGYAKLFYPNFLVDLKNSMCIKQNIDVFQKDLFESEEGNPSTVPNKEGLRGLDFCMNYNGNVNTWENQYLDNLFNIYTDSAEEMIEKSLSDPAILSFLEKGVRYRDGIVSEVNPIAVLRGKAVNIRDYTAPLMFDEARTRLYYTIRVLQDYIEEGRISPQHVQQLPTELYLLLTAPINALQEGYKNAHYTIVEQVLEKEFSKLYYLDMFTWIKLGHYDLPQSKIDRLISAYNHHVSPLDRLQSLADLPERGDPLQIVRMTEYVAHIKPEALQTSCPVEEVAAIQV